MTNLADADSTFSVTKRTTTGATERQNHFNCDFAPIIARKQVPHHLSHTRKTDSWPGLKHGLSGSSEVPDRLSDKSIQSAPDRRKPASIPRIARRRFVTKRDEDSSKSVSLGIESCCPDLRLTVLLGFASMFLSLAAANSYRHVRTGKLGLGA